MALGVGLDQPKYSIPSLTAGRAAHTYSPEMTLLWIREGTLVLEGAPVGTVHLRVFRA
jgi:hypothetical protein